MDGDAFSEILAHTKKGLSREQRKSMLHISAPLYSEVISFFHEKSMFIYVNPVLSDSGREWKWKWHIVDFLKSSEYFRGEYPTFQSAMNDAINKATDMLEDRCPLQTNYEVEKLLDKIEERMKNNNDIIVKDNSIKIKDGYTYPKNTFKDVLDSLRESYPSNNVLLNRSDSSLINEWSVHNLLYNMGLFKKRTKDVDLNYPLGCLEKTVYFLFGKIAWLFIK